MIRWRICWYISFDGSKSFDENAYDSLEKAEAQVRVLNKYYTNILHLLEEETW